MKRREMLAAGLAAGLTPRGALADGGRILPGVPVYAYRDPNFEATRVVLAHRGAPYSAAYVQGVSGMAFRFGGPCPCAPTCTLSMSPDALAQRLGYEVERLTLEHLKPEEVPAAVPAIVARVKQEIDAGRPVAVWHAFTSAEWDVVYGYDELDFYGWGSYRLDGSFPMMATHGRMGTCLSICPAYGATIVGAQTADPDLRALELDALAEAIRHARSPRDPDLDLPEGEIPWKFRNGLACYEVWRLNYERNPQKVPDGPSNRYPLGIYSSTRSAAAPFLREIAPRYPDAAQQLEAAAKQYEADAKALRTIMNEVWGGWGKDAWKEPDPERAAKTAALFGEAAGLYGAGTDALQGALAILDPARLELALAPPEVG